MAAVIAAIVAGFSAGAIALYRERRLEARRLRVAARVVEAEVTLALAGTSAAIEEDSWEAFDEAPGHDSFKKTWEEHREVLAGHLSAQEWRAVQIAASTYLLYFSVVREGPPSESPAREDLEGIRKELREALAPLAGFSQ